MIGACRRWQVDCLKRMLADESHHRDVNHAMASMTTEQMFGQDNPFVHEHIADCAPPAPAARESSARGGVGAWL